MKRLISILAVLFAGFAFLAIAYFWSVKQLTAPLSLEDDVLYTVPQGSSATSVVRDLLDNGLASFPLLTAKVWLKLDQQASAVRAGTYQLTPEMSAVDALYLFASGDEYQFQISLVEGLTLSQWLMLLRADMNLVQDVTGDDALSGLAAAVEGYDSQAWPEGLFLADTYHYTAGTSVSDILRRAGEALSRYIQPQWDSRPGALPYKTPYDVLIMASIIEKETAVASERPLIAGVFVNRLDSGMRLQTDPTVIYGLGDEFDGNLTRQHLRGKTPYNTYTINGLPPTPIAMPGKAAIDAALNPSLTDALYFVSRGDGTHVFSSTLEAHNEAVNQYQRNIKKE